MKKHLFMLALQLIILFVFCMIFNFLRPVRFLYFFLLYIVFPLISAISAGILVRKKMNPYIAWLMPPLAQTLAGFLISLGIAPNPLPIMITSLISLIGAAAGDVMNKSNKKGPL